ncbi:hypothetical protein [Shimazuella kribbensis]|uniref:hypothetical protein n=1 Tax=Shimazuella kribbensis TaxID=139808 RepID=UPI00041F8150|nr:hypothetical protein [Shimazuella kribbensis]
MDCEELEQLLKEKKIKKYRIREYRRPANKPIPVRISSHEPFLWSTVIGRENSEMILKYTNPFHPDKTKRVEWVTR